MNVTNLYYHPDGGHYCLLSDEAPMKHPDTGEWIEGVIYTGIDGRLRSTSLARWRTRFLQCDGYSGDDENILAMIRRTNPDLDFAMEDVWAAWNDGESMITAELIELTACAAVAGMAFGDKAGTTFVLSRDSGLNVVAAEVTLKPKQMRHVLANYVIERVPVDEGYKFKVVRKEA